MAEVWKESTILIAEGEEVATNEGPKYELRIRWQRNPDHVDTRRYNSEEKAIRDLERRVSRLGD